MSSSQAIHQGLRRFLVAGLSVASIAILLTASHPAAAATYTFVGSTIFDQDNNPIGVSTDWNLGINWKNIANGTTGVLPGSGDTVDVNTSDGVLTAGVVSITGNLTSNQIQQAYIGQDNDHNGGAHGNGTVNQNAGILHLDGGNGWLKLGHANGATGFYNMSGTAQLSLTNDWYSVGEDGQGVLTMTDNARIDSPNIAVGRWNDGGGSVTQSGNSIVNTGTLTIGTDNDNTTAGYQQPLCSYTLSGSATLTTSGDIQFGNGQSSNGSFTMNSGTINVGGWMKIGNNVNTTQAFVMHGGTINNSGRFMVSAGGGDHNSSFSGSSSFTQDSTNGPTTIVVNRDFDVGDGGGTGVYTIGGNANLSKMTAGITGSDAGGGGAMDIGWNGNGTVNQLSNSIVDLSSANAGGLEFGGNSNQGQGVYNLSGGTLITRRVFVNNAGTEHGTFNFNGGTLRAANAIGTFMSNLDAVNVQAGGAKLDLNGQTFTIGNALLNGVAGTDGGLTVGSSTGTGRVNLDGASTFNGGVTLNGGIANARGTETAGTSGPLGASGIIKFNGGTLGIANGFDYSSRFDQTPGTAFKIDPRGGTPTFATALVGAGSSLAVSGTGGGTLVLPTANTYTGPTTVSGATLRIDAAGSIIGSPTATVTGGTLRVNGALGSVGTPVTVTVGGSTSSGTPTLAGSGTIVGTVLIDGANGGAAGHGAPGNSIGNLTTGAMTLNSGAVLDFEFGTPGTGPGLSAGNSDRFDVGGALTLPSSGSVTLNLADNAGNGGLGSIGLGTYRLFTETSTVNFSAASSFTIGTTPLPPGRGYLFTNPGGTEIDLTIVLNVWNPNAVSNAWETAANWTAFVPGGVGTTNNQDSALFATAANTGFNNPTPDAGRNVKFIVFDSTDTDTAAAYTIGSNGGNALHLSTGGGVTMSSTVVNNEVVAAPLVLEGANGTSTFTNNSAASTLTISGGISGNAAGTTVLTLNGSNIGANTLSGSISDGAATHVAVVKDGAGAWSLTGNSSFSGGLTVTNGTLRVSGNNTFTGGVSIGAGTLNVLSAGALNSTTPTNVVTFTGAGALNLNGNSIQLGGLAGTTGAVNNGSATPVTLTLNATGASSYSGALNDGGGGGALSIATTGGAGSQLLGGQNTYTGGTTLSGGTLGVASSSTVTGGVLTSGPLGTGSLSISGGTLSSDASARVISNTTSISGNVTFGGAGAIVFDNQLGPTAQGTINLTNNPTLTVNNFATVINSAINTTGALNKSGPGALLISNAANSFTGANVSQGVLAVVNSGVNPAYLGGTGSPLGTGAVTLSGGTLALRGQAIPAIPGMGIQLYNIAPNSANFDTLQHLTTHLNSSTMNQVNITTADTTHGPSLDYSNAGYGGAAPFGVSSATQANFGAGYADNIEAFWNGGIYITQAGNYTFLATSDDGTMMWVDQGTGNGVASGTPLVNNNFFQGATTRTGSVFLTPGFHSLQLAFYEGGGGAGALFQYNGPDTGGTNFTINAANANSQQGLVFLDLSQSYANSVNVTANSGIDVSGSLGATMGATTITGGKTLATSSSDVTPAGYALKLASTTVSGAGNVTFNVANSSGGGRGSLDPGAITGGASQIVKSGAGELRMYANNAYTGGTLIQQGTVNVSKLNGSNPLGSGAVTLSGGTLRLGGSSSTANAGLKAYFYNDNIPFAPLNALTSTEAHFATLTPAVSTDTTGGGAWTKLDWQGTNDNNAGVGIFSPVFTAAPAAGDNYTAKMVGVINITTPGSYIFSTSSDDGSALFLDGQNVPVVNNNFDQGRTERFNTPISLSAGPHTLEVAYYEHGGGANFTVNYIGPDVFASQLPLAQNPQVAIPNTVLSQLDAAQSYANDVVVTADSSIAISGSLTASLGNLSIGGNTLNLTGGDGIGFALTMGSVTMTGNPTINIAATAFNPGASSLTVGSLNDGGTARTITVNGGGTLRVTSAATSVQPGTVFNLNGSGLVSNNATAIGTRSQITMTGAGSSFKSGASQTVASLNGPGSVSLAAATSLTIGGADNLNSVIGGIVDGSGASLIKSGNGSLTLNNIGYYTAGTTLNSGTLVSNLTSSLGTGPVTLNGGTLRVAGSQGASASVSGFGGSGTGWALNGGPSIAADVLHITDQNNGEARSAWFTTQQPYAIGHTGFTASFRYQMPSGGNPADGATFAIQTVGQGANGNGGGALAVDTIVPAMAYEINVYNGHQRGTNLVASSLVGQRLIPTGTYLSTAPVDFDNGVVAAADPLDVTLVYDPVNHTVSETLHDVTANTTYNHVYSNVDLSNVFAGASTAYIGFTGGTGGLNADQFISNFSFSVPSAAPANIYSNSLILPGGATSTIDVAGSTISMGPLAIGNGAGTTLNVTGTTLAANAPYTLAVGNTSLGGNATINVANNGTGTGTLALGSITDGGSSRTLTKEGAGTLEIRSAPDLSGPATTLTVNTGRLRFNNVGGNTANVTSGLTVNVNNAATLELAGDTSALSDGTSANSAKIHNNSTAGTAPADLGDLTKGGVLVTDTSGNVQQVGAIDGTGATKVATGANLLVNSIVQGAVEIGGTAFTSSTLSIQASASDGTPVDPAGIALASLSHNSPLPLGSNLLAGGTGSGSLGSLGSVGGLGGIGGGTAAVPEPSSIVLVVLGAAACLVGAARRKARKA